MMEVLRLSLVGGLLALDATSVGQFMISRPLVAGLLAGWVSGDPPLGLLIGALLELYLLVSFPTGGARFPEGATATVVAVATAAATDGVGAVPLAVALGLVWGQLGGFTITWLRRLNGRLVPVPDGPHPEAVTWAHLGAVGLDFLRGVAVTASGIVLGRVAVAAVVRAWPLGARGSMGLLLVGGAVSAGIFLRSLGGFRRRRLLFMGGVALGILGARFL
ncbi:MAG: PTS sugar transporter subunit IIC [Gemmatimonadetes bacterium]|nr:PTS sugar transporter subunit IIC [Gemmatimonadota bacterium]